MQPTEPQVGAPEPFRYGDDAPTWARGKTAEELLDVASTMYNAISTSQPYQSQTQYPQQTSMPSQPNGQPDHNLMYTDPAEYQRQLVQYNQIMMQETMRQQAEPLLHSNAELAKAEAKRNPSYTEVWERYGPEIEAELASLPMQLKVNPKIWNDAAALIKGRHAEELFKARLASKQTDTGTMSADGLGATGTAPSTSSPIEKAWHENAEWIQKFKKLPGMNLHKLRSQVASMGRSEADYVKHYESKNALFIHGSDGEMSRLGVS